MVRRLGMAYFAGAVGALVASLLFWLVGKTALFAAIGVSLAPELSWSWLESRLIWGSLFGLGYPLVRRRGFPPVRAALVLSLLPSAVQLFAIMPHAGQGFLGLSQGGFTPLVVLAINAVWGWSLARIMISAGHS